MWSPYVKQSGPVPPSVTSAPSLSAFSCDFWQHFCSSDNCVSNINYCAMCASPFLTMLPDCLLQHSRLKDRLLQLTACWHDWPKLQRVQNIYELCNVLANWTYHCCTHLVSEMTYTVSSGTLNSTILYYTCTHQNKTNALIKLHWLPVKQRVLYKQALITFTVLHHNTPRYLRDLLTIHNPSRNLRSSSHHLLSVGHMRTVSSSRCYKHWLCRYQLEWSDIRICDFVSVLSVNLKVIFLPLPMLPSHMSPPRLRITFYVTYGPCTGSRVVRIDPLRFLARCRKKRLNQALSVLSLSLGFLWLCIVLLTRDSF